MTRELARNILTELKNLMAKEKEPLSEEQEALEMAISSLKQNESAEAWYRTFVEKFESCEDCVSREAVKEQIKGWIGSGEHRYGDGYTLLYDRINELPSVQPSRKGWEEMIVPCKNCGHDMTFKIAVCGEPSRKGHWRDYSEGGYVECPFCEHATTWEDNTDELHYCFYCGAELSADMKGDTDEAY